MQKSIFTFILIFLCNACAQEERYELDYFVFGVYATDCVKDCTKLVKIQNNIMYLDNVFSSSDNVTFGSIQLNPNYLNRAKWLQTNIPVSITSSSLDIFGCPDCYKQGGYYIGYKKNGKTRVIRIDNDRTKIKDASIITYIDSVENIINLF